MRTKKGHVDSRSTLSRSLIIITNMDHSSPFDPFSPTKRTMKADPVVGFAEETRS